MQIFKDIDSLRNFIISQKTAGKKIGLVPTMGALHKGHLSLVRNSQSKTSLTVVSIFVNPMQFNNPSDLEKYPRTLESDLALLETTKCDVVFCPSAKEVYQTFPNLTVSFGALDSLHEGKFRPGHFSGVAIVVSKLFNLVQPDFAFFGQKDYQQYLVLSRLVEDLSFPIKLVCGEIIRESDGLAMSSRNKRLSQSERSVAPVIYNALLEAKAQLAGKSLAQIKKETEANLRQAGLRVEYFELADRINLIPQEKFNPTMPSILLIAAYLGEVRLIDNMLVS